MSDFANGWTKVLLFMLIITVGLNCFADAGSEKFTCVFQSTGNLEKIKFRGETREIAYERVVKLCLGLRVQQYYTLRLQNPSTERTIMFMEDCVNKTYCIEKVD